jgi:hypothetical protein
LEYGESIETKGKKFIYNEDSNGQREIIGVPSLLEE